jgi:eukaryotic-like serine/threonine-protein kinase
MRFCPQCHGRYEDGSRFCPRDGAALPQDDDDPRIGTVLMGQFELLATCGKGAMGTVYRAWQTPMDRQVAIKLLRPELIRDPAVVKRFDREARAVARIVHPNIVTFFLVGATDDALPFVVMEYVDGPSLAQVVDAEPRFEPARALRIGRQITSALAEAHAEGIVHRDLKPANILLAQRRRTQDFVKVVDFGIAKVLRGETTNLRATDPESRLTRTGAVFGTPHYLSPEQAAGAEVDHRADLYSLGVILYRLITGRLPFDGTGIAVLIQHIQQALPPPREVFPQIDPRLERFLVKALEKDPNERFQSAEEMSDALDAVASEISGGNTAWTSFSGRMQAVRSGSEPSQPRAPTSPIQPRDTSQPSQPRLAARAAGGTLQGLGGGPLAADPQAVSEAAAAAAGATAAAAGAVPAYAAPLPAGYQELESPPAAISHVEGSRTDAPAIVDDDGAGARDPAPRSRAPLFIALAGVLVASGAVAAAYLLGRGTSGLSVFPGPATAPAAAGASSPSVSGAAASSAPASVPPAATGPEASGQSTPASADPVAAPTVAPAVAADVGAAAAPDAPTRTHTVGEAGYSIRATVPETIEPGREIEITFLVLDPDGKPVTVPVLPASVEDPRGAKSAVEIGAAAAPGTFSLKTSFAAAGRYHMHLYPIPGKKTVVWFDLLVGPQATALPPRAEARPATAGGAAGSHRDAHEGGSSSDPYHLLDDMPRDRPHVTRPSRPRPPKPANDNPDGLE